MADVRMPLMLRDAIEQGDIVRVRQTMQDYWNRSSEFIQALQERTERVEAAYRELLAAAERVDEYISKWRTQYTIPNSGAVQESLRAAIEAVKGGQ